MSGMTEPDLVARASLGRAGPPPTYRAAPAAREDDDAGARWVAVLLAFAALLAATLATRAAFLSDDASDAWQTALRQELRRSVAALTDIRYVYGPLGDMTFMIATQEVLAEEYRSGAQGAEPAFADVLEAEARVHEGVVEAMLPSLEIAGDPPRLEGGGFDLGGALAAERERMPDLVAIDPDASQAEGDRLARQATLTLAASLPVGFAFLAGALAMPYRRHRRLLMTVGWAACGVAIVAALMLELA
jgi:hypothetical protein